MFCIYYIENCKTRGRHELKFGRYPVPIIFYLAGTRYPALPKILKLNIFKKPSSMLKMSYVMWHDSRPENEIPTHYYLIIIISASEIYDSKLRLYQIRWLTLNSSKKNKSCQRYGTYSNRWVEISSIWFIL